jgi:hypothetical protein
MANLTTVKIYPPIGIARMGNSQEWYLGPELPFPAPPPVPADGKYKDNQCRIRRQAQRFRLWGYYDDGTDHELTIADGEIQWTVHVANAKAVFRGEPGGLIDPGSRTLNGPNDSATFANGAYHYSGQVVEVPLGDASTDADGRLIVRGAFGFSSTPVANNQPTAWLENPGWHDDVCDGPVNATITVGGTVFNAVGAWVICPAPRFAPSTYSPITLYDTLRQIAIDLHLLTAPGEPVFETDIWPILTRGIGMLRVSAMTFGSGDHGTLSGVIPPASGQDAARAAIFSHMANPAGGGGNMPLLNPGGLLPILNEQDVAPTLRQFQYDQMKAWSLGNFTSNWPPKVPTTITPEGLTQAVLENCVGAPFYPGIEATLTVRDGSIKYTEAFRFDQTGMTPGQVTMAMARPWQADFTACTGSDAPDGADWWPGARPDAIYPQGSTTAVDWTRDLVSSYQDMVDNWFRLGFIVDPGTGLAVETERSVVCKDCYIVTDRNEIGQEEAAALILAGQSIIDAFYVVVEGFAPSDLGIMTATPSPIQLQAWAPNVVFNPAPTQMKWAVHDMLLENNSALTTAQRITFGYNISFTGTNDFGLDVTPFQLTASTHGVSGTAEIDLTQVDAPYMDHGPISYLSNDTRVFKVLNGKPFPGTSVTLTGNDPIKFIQAVLTELRTTLTPAQAFSTFENLPSGEDATDQLEWNPQIGGVNVYNFALCRVRYRATTTVAKDVRVFFRLFQTAATGTEYNASTTYRVGGGVGLKIPLLGIQGGELVTIPFFAEARNANTVNLNLQTDSNNIASINPGAGGAESYMYYGVWLDINQPLDLRFPIQPSPVDGGPFTGTLQSIANLIRGTHQCMVTEISFDPEGISPPGVSTASSDMLSQRNLAIDNSDNPGSADSHRVQHTFAIHPTTSTPVAKQGPDELMIAWGNTPLGTLATIYLPGVRSAEILSLAGRNFNLQTLTRVDDHTISCRTAGVTYIPIPSGGTLDLAGLITLNLPDTVRKGQTFRVVCRQVMDVPAPAPVPRQRGGNIPATRDIIVRQSSARHILGAFQFSIQVKTANEILPIDERALTAFKRTIATVPVENRWYPVLTRIISQLGSRITVVGGGHHHHHGHEPEPCRPEEHREEHLHEGKICGVQFDHFGDFEGFWLETAAGKRRYRSREKEIEEVVREAWEKRVPILVAGHEESVESIVFLRPPVGY